MLYVNHTTMTTIQAPLNVYISIQQEISETDMFPIRI